MNRRRLLALLPASALGVAAGGLVRPGHKRQEGSARTTVKMEVLTDRGWREVDSLACDVCGAPASMSLSDLVEIPRPHGWREVLPTGIVRRGCDSHPPKRRKAIKVSRTLAVRIGEISDDENVWFAPGAIIEMIQAEHPQYPAIT